MCVCRTQECCIDSNQLCESYQLSVHLCVCARVTEVSESQLTPSQKLVHRSIERLGGYRRGAIQGAYNGTAYR